MFVACFFSQLSGILISQSQKNSVCDASFKHQSYFKKGSIDEAYCNTVIPICFFSCKIICAIQARTRFCFRNLVAANHSSGNPQSHFMDYVAQGFFTDDHGKTFHLVQSINLPGSNESMATELSYDKLMMNSRNQRGDVRARIVSISSDGGASWRLLILTTH
jgi:hypothetical protein